jgi:hypothetical protein
MEKLNDILKIPERCLVAKKITKAFFKRNFDLTSQERVLLDDAAAVISIDWIASLSPVSSNVPLYKEGLEVYEEVQVIAVKTDGSIFERNKLKIAELVQKYIPYPILLCVYADTKFIFNTCDKRINQNDNAKRTIEKRLFTENINITEQSVAQQAFIESLEYANIDKTTLKTLYEGYSQRIVALQAAELSGMFILRSHSRTQQDMENLERIEAIEKEITLLQVQAKKETQMNQRVELNLKVQQKRKEVDQLKSLITQ